MKEFLLLIRTEGDVWTSLSPKQLQDHIEHGTAYIGKLVKEGKLKNAAPAGQRKPHRNGPERDNERRTV